MSNIMMDMLKLRHYATSFLTSEIKKRQRLPLTDCPLSMFYIYKMLPVQYFRHISEVDEYKVSYFQYESEVCTT